MASGSIIGGDAVMVTNPQTYLDRFNQLRYQMAVEIIASDLMEHERDLQRPEARKRAIALLDAQDRLSLVQYRMGQALGALMTLGCKIIDKDGSIINHQLEQGDN